ncbi:hypothetical protein CRUP_000791 [Coryphaenoides rupestris]|nr:hypothetical protein CRUP_000791 [Coryphaenoides rupestris]
MERPLYAAFEARGRGGGGGGAPREGPVSGACTADGPPITSASLETLIQNLVPTADYYPEKPYVFTFLLSARLFIPPPELLSRAKVRKFGPKLLQLLKEWTETFPSDFREEKMVGHLEDLIHRIAPCDEEHLGHIGPEEFVQAFVQKDPLDTTQPCFSDQKKTSNLEAYVRWFNRLCYLVATEICMPAKKKQRAQVIEFFIDVARECFNIGNFNSLMAIICECLFVPRRHTLECIHQMDPTGNFYNYRTALRGAAHRSQTANSSRERKIVELARQVGEFMTWKQVEWLYLASYESESPENQVEKDRSNVLGKT